MEQKTEASQAVDEPMRADFEEWHRSKFATRHTTGQPTRDMHNGIYAEEYGPEHQQKMWESWQASRAALKAQPVEIDQALLRVLKEACDLAMKNTVAARVPECGDFGALAQDLDYVISRLKAKPAPTESAQAEDSARLDAERYRYFRRIYGAEARLIRGPIFIAETPEQFDAGIDECIRYEQEAARASAETGGVKS